MNGWRITLGIIVVAAIPAALYGLHRLALRLEERGYLYYLKTKPRGGGGNAFVPIQELIEPQVEHVLHVRDEIREDDEDGAPGPGAPRPFRPRTGPTRSD